MLRSHDDLGTPLHEVTFCVVDLETTGASARTCEITEVGAARFRGGERLGTFQTLVEPGAPIDPAVSALTGITDAMVHDAPTPSQVLPTLLEFVGGAVLVGHNLRFDVGFLDAALLADERAPVGLWAVDTLALARRLLGDEVPDHRLGTLADHLGLDHRPTHRALDDVLATADLLHALLERATAFGVTVLDDLLALPRLAAHAQAAKLRLTNRLPRAPGVAVLRDGQGAPLHVAAADDDLRRSVRSWFSGEGGRAAGPVLREVQAIDHLVCPSPLAAEVAEVRLTDALAPRRSPLAAAWKGYRYVRLGAGRAARGRGHGGAAVLTVGRTPGRGRALGPLPSADQARAVIDAVELALGDPPAEAASIGGLFDDPGPASGEPTADDLFDDPARLLAALREQASAARDRGGLAQARTIEGLAEALDDALARHRWSHALRGAGRVVLATAGGEGVELARGRPVRSWTARGDATPVARAPAGELAPIAFDPPATTGEQAPLTPAVADELACVAAWIERHATDLQLLHVDGELSSPLPRRPTGLARRPSPGGLRCAAC